MFFVNCGVLVGAFLATQLQGMKNDKMSRIEWRQQPFDKLDTRIF